MTAIVPFRTGLSYSAAKSYGGDNDNWKLSLASFLTPQALPELYGVLTAVGGQMIRPIFCGENQNDHVQRGKSFSHIAIMKRVQRQTQCLIEQYDAAASRIFILAQSKYGMHHNGDHGDNAMRKKVCLATVRRLFECCEAYELLNFLDQVAASGFETDDLADAFSVALQKAMDWFTERTKAIYGGKSVGRFGVDAERAKALEGQGVGAAGFDFGTRNFALCILEVTSMDAAQEETYVTCDNETKTHWIERPHFRVLRWQLLDLLDNKVTADYRGPSRVYRRRDIGVNITASAYDPKAEARKEKRAKKALADPAGAKKEKPKATNKRKRDADVKEPKVRKRAKREKPKIISIDLLEE